MAIGRNYGIDNGEKSLGHNLKRGGRSLTQNAQLSSLTHGWPIIGLGKERRYKMK